MHPTWPSQDLRAICYVGPD